MCTYITENVTVSGSGKGPDGWFALGRATVSFDHPFHAPIDHTLNVDFADPSAPGRRLAVELSPESAMDLARAIVVAVEAGRACLAGVASPPPAG
jgi:hypothetical protein